MEYFEGNDAAGKYLHVTGRKISLYRRMGLIKAMRGGYGWIYSQDELDRFMKEWQGFSLRNEEEIMVAKRLKNSGVSGERKSIRAYGA